MGMHDARARGFRARLTAGGLIVAMGLGHSGALAAPAQGARFAQTSASDKAAAEALFDEGVALLKQRDYPAACKKLEASQRIDPGIGTLLYLADCYEKSGRTASAWATFREAASMAQEAGQQDRARAGLDRAERLRPQLSKLTIELSGTDAELEGVEVHYLQAESGDRAMASAAVGTAVPVDPGTYTVKVKAPGYQTYEGQVTVGGNAASEKHVVPPLALAPEEAAPVDEPPPAEEPATPGDEAPSENNWQKPTGIALAGAGVVGVALGAVFGLVAMDQNNQAIDAGCSNDACNSRDGSELTDQALTSATVSTVAFAVGGVLLAGGAVLYFTAPKSAGPKKKSGSVSVVDFEFAGSARPGNFGGAHSPPSGARPPSLFVAPTLGGARIGFGGSF